MRLRFWFLVSGACWTGYVTACASKSEDCAVLRTCASDGASGGVAGKGGSSAGKSGSSGNAGNGSGAAGESGATGGQGVGGDAAGNAGSGGQAPCDGACGGATPTCDEEADTCVECTDNEHCEGDTAYCNDANECVECLDNPHCTDPTASRCNDGVCVGCGSNTHCSHITDATVCDTDADECVECTVAEEEPCEGASCNPATNQCTNTPIESVGLCEPCVADSECEGGATVDPETRCIPLDFQGESRDGGYCLRRQSKTCSKPFTVSVSSPSMSGASEETYCGVNELTVSCEAVLDLAVVGATCPGGEDSECGCIRDEEENCVGTGIGGLCETVGGVPNTCTYACGIPLECPGTLGCDVFCK